MLLIKNHGFKRQYAYGGAGIFDSIASFLGKLFTSNAAKAITTTALDAGKTAARAVGKKVIDVGKTAALDGAQRLTTAAVTKLLTPKSQSILQNHIGVPMQHSSPDFIAKKAQSILSKYIDTGAQNINSLIDGSGVGLPLAQPLVGHNQNAIAIQDLVRKLNGSGLKIV